MRKAALPGREAILELLHSKGGAVHGREIAAELHVDRSDYEALLDVLGDLAASGAVTKDGQRFRFRTEAGAPRRRDEREGILSVNARGFGFVASVGFDDNLYVSEDALAGAMHGDVVVARLVGRTSRGSEGEIVRVVSRGNPRVAGVLRRKGKALWLEPDDARMRGPVLLQGEAAEKAAGQDGDAAVARITRYPEMTRETPEGELIAVLGTPGDPKVEVAKILVREAIEEEHPSDAVAEAEAFGTEVAKDALVSREDLTHLPLPTIDPEDARDHDDAVWGVRQHDGSYKVWIAIADVSAYVRPGTALDKAALARGCSIYLPDRAIPMLPRALSSSLCSLLPGVIRLCLCVEAEIEPDGTTRSFRVVEGFMRSAAKLTYGGVARALGFTDKPEKSPPAEAMRDDLKVLHDLAMILRTQRLRRGALDFDLPEPKMVLDPTTGAPTSVEKRSEDPGVKKAYQLIEELMLLANELVAQHLTERGIPAIFRVHGAPDEAKLDRFASMATALGLPFELEDAKDPKKLSALLKRVAKHPSHAVFNMLLLRAMKQATYDTANIGHFGLASTAYLHFTSPIRRYPDLVVHRATRALLARKSVDKSPGMLESLRVSAMTASNRERHAMEVEREVVDLYRALYMRGHIGDSFTGKVTAVVGSGVFVQIDSPFVDVLVKTEALGDDRYELDDEGMRMIGRRSGDSIGLGDTMSIVIEDVAILRRSIYGRRVGTAAQELAKGRRGRAQPRPENARRSPRPGAQPERRGASAERRSGGKEERRGTGAAARPAAGRPARPAATSKRKQGSTSKKKTKRR